MTQPADVFEIDDARTLEMLADPLRLELLEHLYQPASVSEVAEVLDVPRTRLYHHVRLLEQAGMIKVVRTRQRGAIPEKIYQVTAKDFRPSARFLAESRPRQVIAAIVDSLLSFTRMDITRSFTEGRFAFGERTEHRRAMLSRNLVMLSPGRLHTFLAELQGLIDRYDDQPDPDGEPVAIVALVYPSSRQATR